MKISHQPFNGTFILDVSRNIDSRGNLSKIFNSTIFNRLGIDFTPVEIFVSVSKSNVIRGMHLLLPPFDGSKLVYCTKGKALDVLIDLRPDSQTYKEVFSILLKEDSCLAIFIPPGIAHGFYSYENDTTLTYITDGLYDSEFDGGINFSSINFKWPTDNPIISNRDCHLPNLEVWINPYSKFDINVLANTSKKVLVSGATGFLGSNLVSRLLDLKWEVNVIVRDTSRLEKLDSRLSKSNIFIFDGNPNSLSELFFKNKPDYVFHTAACTFYDYNIEQIDEIIDSNIKLGLLILELMKINNIKNFINTGTSWQHYDNNSYSPVNLYAATKQGFEDILDYYVDAHNFKIITLKLFDTYGVGDTRNKIVNLLVNSGKSNQEVSLSGCQQIVDIISIEDVVRAFLASTQYFSINRNFHLKYGLSSNDRISLSDLVLKIVSKLRKKPRILFGGRKYRDREVFLPWNPPRVLPNWTSTKGALNLYLEKLDE